MRHLSLAVVALLLSIALPALAQQPAGSSCYSYRTKGSDAFQIACYPDAASCNKNKADYTGKNPNIEALGCAPQIYCFTYNAEGKSAACYLDGNVCVTERNKLAAKGGAVGSCVSNTRPGKPATANYGPPANCFSYHEPGSVAPSVFCARNAAACNQGMTDKRNYLTGKGATAGELAMAGNCGAPMYCLNATTTNTSNVTCYPSADACEKVRAASKGMRFLGACTINDYQGTHPAKN
jgi:hypothetical protein